LIFQKSAFKNSSYWQRWFRHQKNDERWVSLWIAPEALKLERSDFSKPFMLVLLYPPEA
jgi:hypothetical protein